MGERDYKAKVRQIKSKNTNYVFHEKMQLSQLYHNFFYFFLSSLVFKSILKIILLWYTKYIKFAMCRVTEKLFLCV
jgi:hypothetical protein